VIPVVFLKFFAQMTGGINCNKTHNFSSFSDTLNCHEGRAIIEGKAILRSSSFFEKFAEASLPNHISLLTSRFLYAIVSLDHFSLLTLNFLINPQLTHFSHLIKWPHNPTVN
jgi:hypothetical protein